MGRSQNLLDLFYQRVRRGRPERRESLVEVKLNSPGIVGRAWPRHLPLWERENNPPTGAGARTCPPTPRAFFASNLSQEEGSLEIDSWPCLAGLWLCPAGGAMTQDSLGPRADLLLNPDS